MEKKTIVIPTEEDLLVDLTFHKVPALLLVDFAKKIVRPYYGGNLNVAIQDLIKKMLTEQEFVISHIAYLKTRWRLNSIGEDCSIF
jgi:hypothetical protein